MYTKLQALELAKEWLDRYREEPAACEECGECDGTVVCSVGDELAREIILERQRERESARSKPPAGSNQPAGVGLTSRCGGGI